MADYKWPEAEKRTHLGKSCLAHRRRGQSVGQG